MTLNTHIITKFTRQGRTENRFATTQMGQATASAHTAMLGAGWEESPWLESVMPRHDWAQPDPYPMFDARYDFLRQTTKPPRITSRAMVAYKKNGLGAGAFSGCAGGAAGLGCTASPFISSGCSAVCIVFVGEGEGSFCSENEMF